MEFVEESGISEARAEKMWDKTISEDISGSWTAE